MKSLISLRDVSDAVDKARERLGSELAELLTAEPMTEEEMDELEDSPKPGDELGSET